MPKQTAAQKRAADKYKAKLERIGIFAEPEVVEQIKTYAAGRGETVKGFIIRACQEQMKRDRGE